MRPIPTTLAAMAAAAAVAAAITIPAIAQSGDDAQDHGIARLTSCLTTHGVTVPSGLDGPALKPWLGARQNDPTVRAALKACAGGTVSSSGEGACGGAKPAPSSDSPADARKKGGA
jgi:hypothetical protein